MIDTTRHSEHLPTIWKYHGSDQLPTRFNKDKELLPEGCDFSLHPFSIDSLTRGALLDACRGKAVCTIALREWFLSDQSRIPDSWQEYFRIYFLGTIPKHSFGTPCVLFVQKDIFLTESQTQVWKPGWMQIVPQASVAEGSAFISA